MNYLWRDLLHKLGIGLTKPHYLRYGNRFYWYDDEAFIQLYMELSKGGCKDFIETVLYIKDIEGLDEYYYTEAYSHLEFKNRTLLGTVTDPGFYFRNMEIFENAGRTE